MRFGLLTLLTASCFLALPQAFAEAPLCRHIWISTDLKIEVQDKLTDLQGTLLKLRLELKKDSLSPDPLSVLKNLDNDPRELAYLLQGSYRLIIAHPRAATVLTAKDFSRLEKGLKEVKWLEKTLGQYSVQLELLETAQSKNLAPDFIEYLTQRRNEVSQKTYKLLKDADYLNKEVSAVNELLEKLAKIQWPPGFDSIQWIKQSLQSEIYRVNEKVQTEMAPLIRKPLYGYREVEDGAHAFRRSLRWIKMYLNAYQSQFRLVSQPNKTAGEQELVNKFQDKFVLYYDSLGQIQIRDVDYAQLIKSVDALRKIKRNGEMMELLSHELTMFGRYNGQAVTADSARIIIYDLLKKDDGKIERKTQEMLSDYETRNAYQDMIMEDKE